MSILLIHGVGGRPTSWDRVLPYLSPAVRGQTVAVDVTVQTGQSMLDVVHDLLERQPGSHILVGHSFGGMVAQEAALIAPARVRGLVLVSTIPGATPRVAHINRNLADTIDADGLDAVALRLAAGLFGPSRAEHSPELASKFVAEMLDAGSTSVCAALRAIANWDASDRLNTITCPVTVLAGDAEPDIDRQSLLSELSGGKFEVLRDTGHLAPLESPAAVARAIAEMAGTQVAQT